MKKFIKSVLLLALTILLSVVVIPTKSQVDKSSAATFEEGNFKELNEEKVFSKATINDDFTGDSVYLLDDINIK
jgi:hypothetical protein